MDEQIKKVDVEAIMSEIRAEIAAKGEVEVLPGFDEATIDQVCEGGVAVDMNYSAGELHDMITHANEEHNITYYQMIPAGGIKSFIKRSIRKLLAGIFIPIRDAQNRFDSYTVRTFFQLEAYISQLEDRLAVQESDMEKLTERIQELEDVCDQLKIAREAGEK